ncbi:MAG: GNAT family N-acetyltransferase [Lachnospiraceae bacterium]|nr:GNAT family N-acetyltransferase [Lachnospiraceae bacterium]
MSMVIDETKRLIIREIEEKEADEAAELLTLFGENKGKTFTRDMVTAYIKVAYGFYGYGYWGLFEKESNELVGLAGFREGSCPLEVGYCVREDKRGRGYATEALKSLTEFAEEDFLWVLDEEKQGEEVRGEVLMTLEREGKVLAYARTTKDNIASVRVLQKNGFKECKGFTR